MAEVTDVTIAAGVPTVGTGTVPTLSKTNTVIGAVDETAPATDTASSGTNGRLQRVAQRITSLIALLPTALGAGGGLKVDGSGTALPISGAVTQSGTWTVQPGNTANTTAWKVDGSAVVQPSVNRYFSGVATTLTRPANATPYTANDSISDNASAGSVTALVATVSAVNDDPICVTEIIVDTNDTGLAAGIPIRAYLFNADPTASTGVGAGDNVAYSQKRNGFIGSMSGTFRAFSDGGKARLTPDEGSYIIANPTSGAETLFIQYQTLAAFTPSANSTTLIGKIRGFQGRA